MVDIALIIFTLFGAIMGYLRGAYAGIILLFATYLPLFVFVYFYDFITEFIDGVIQNTSQSSTAALGCLGAFSGIIAFLGFGGAVFFITRLMLKIMSIEKLELGDKIGGFIVGAIGQTIVATLAFFLIYTAIPTKTAQVVQGSYWVKILRPIHLFTYPHYLSFLQARTQKLSFSIAQKGVGETLLGGVSVGGINEGLGFDAPNLAEAKEAIAALAKNIDIEEFSALVKQTDISDLSAEEIDRQIQKEQATRLNIIKNQLQ